MLQKLRRNRNQKGFTLIELMIVIAIIGILAAIAVPQFMAYRLRSWNTTAKAVDHNMKLDQSNLNAELGVYGHTEAAAALLQAIDGGVGVADTFTVPALAVSATNAAAGARLVGTTNDALRQQQVEVSIGRNMIVSVMDFNNANDDSTFHAFARHYKADTAYAIDNDIENVIYSVTNPIWPNNAGLMATAIAPAWPPAVDIENVAGGGAPIVNWTRVR